MQRLDVSGLMTPAPILEIRRALARLKPGEHLEVIGDDPGLVRDVPAFCAQSSHELLMVRPANDAKVIFELAAGSSQADVAPSAVHLAKSA